MTERPIIFSGPMVRAILDGRKTQTRRVVKPQPPDWVDSFGYTYFTPEGHISGRGRYSPGNDDDVPGEKYFRCPYGAPGDRLYVRETWAPVDDLAFSVQKDPPETIGYRADKTALYMGKPLDTFAWNWDMVTWKPSIHMRKDYARIWLEVTGVRVERVMDISAEDVGAEGLQADQHGSFKVGDKWFHYHDLAFAKLWDEINKKRGYGWDVNPWVWVVSFRRVEP